MKVKFFRNHKRHNNRLRHIRILALALLVGVALTLLTCIPFGPLSLTEGVALAHALPVRADPAPNAVVKTPPKQATIWFDARLVSATSHIVVDNAQSQQVNTQDSVVSTSNPLEMSVALPSSLPGGTYTVLWVAQSADDGHVTQGSFTFRIVGSGQPLAVLPTGHGAGKGGFTLNGPVIVQAITTWLALLGMTFWVGGLIWETWILSPATDNDPDLIAAGIGAAYRYRRLAPAALYLIWVANVGLVCSLVAQYTGSWRGVVQLSVWQTILLGSSFGFFWWMRQIVVAVVLIVATLADERGWSRYRKRDVVVADKKEVVLAIIPDWWHAVRETLRRIPNLPAQLVRGWRERSWLGRLELLLGLALLLAFALSGHAAAVPGSELPYSLSVDMLHLIGNAAWVGGLLYIGFALIPALSRLNERQHARVLALGLPRFSALAIICALVLAATGSLNTTIHFTSIMQFVTTLYGEVLATKILLFLVMVAVSAYHAFSLRPRLAYLLRQHKYTARAVPVKVASGRPGKSEAGRELDVEAERDKEHIPTQARILAIRMEIWLHREALLGLAVLMCVALLSIFAGTL